MLTLNTPISALTKIGAKVAPKLKKFGLATAGDLLSYFPFRYDDFRAIVPIKDLREGMSATIRVKIATITNRRSFKTRRVVTEALVADDTGTVRVTWFNQPYIGKMLTPGRDVYLAGAVKRDMLGPQLVGPTFEFYNSQKPSAHTGRLVPIYPLTAGVSQKQIRFLISQVLPLAGQLPEWLPEDIIAAHRLLGLRAAIAAVHFPDNEKILRQSLARLKFDELFLIQLQAALARRELASILAPTLIFQEAAIKKFVGSLPFSLTAAQKIAAWEILRDIAKPHPMNRLLSGDVGSGKTVVAALAAYNAILNGHQVACLAPTEILARQHFETFSRVFGNAISLGLLTNTQCELNSVRLNYKSRPRQRQALAEKIQSGAIQIVVGTHALLTKDVQFKKLGLAVVDEQHRFGVGQRQLMKKKGRGVHFLSMTATPIPRSLALALYGDLDISVINELPPGRQRIITRLAPEAKRAAAYEFIRQQIKKGRQAFVICPLIEKGAESSATGEFDPGFLLGLAVPSSLERRTVLTEYERLSKKVFADLRLGFLHGKMPGPAKQATMERFVKGKIDILVSTSVVEVGVDVPNASVMMIEGAEYFGLAQLHQFRGRVGRSSHQSYCVLFTGTDNEKTLERLRYFEQEQNGFKLAEKDLEMRGPGQMYGTEQSGSWGLKLARLSDTALIRETRTAAKNLVDKNVAAAEALIKKIAPATGAVHLE